MALTQEQIDWYIKLKKAETGVKILKCPETPEYRPLPDKDLALYEVCGFHFEDVKTAQEIADLVNSKMLKALRVDYDYYRGGSEHKYAKPYEGNLVNVDSVKVFSKPIYDSIKDILSSNKKIEEAYNKLKKEYDAEEGKSTEIVDKIYDAIAKARERKEQQEEYLNRIQEYLRLANGNIEIAWNFFDKAYAVEPSVKNKIMESEEYKNAVAGY